jgi:hypothetical protein
MSKDPGRGRRGRREGRGTTNRVGKQRAERKQGRAGAIPSTVLISRSSRRSAPVMRNSRVG